MTGLFADTKPWRKVLLMAETDELALQKKNMQQQPLPTAMRTGQENFHQRLALSCN